MGIANWQTTVNSAFEILHDCTLVLKWSLNILVCGQFNGESQTFQAGNKKANVSFQSAYLSALRIRFLSPLCTELTAINYHFCWDCFRITKIIVVSCASKVKRICLEVPTRFPISVFREIVMRNQFSNES